MRLFAVALALVLQSAQSSSPVQVAAQGLTTFRLANGGIVRGELVHTYHQSQWWNATSETTYAVYIANGYAAYPHDRSLRFLSTPDVVEVIPPNLSSELQAYPLMMQREGLILQHSPLRGVSFVITGNSSYHLEENGYGDFAWDFTRTNGAGQRYRNAGFQNSDYFVWGEPVYLPRGGVVVEVVRNQPDNPPGRYPKGAPNNMLGVQVGGAYSLYLLHFQQGSIPAHIKPGDTLTAGTFVGLVGNAGVSLEPHLHITMLWWDAAAQVPRYWSVPSEFQNLYMRTVHQRHSNFSPYAVPGSNTWVADVLF